MRLARVEVHGYKKLVETGCTTPGKLVAVVGPNEAGKSTLLNALRSLGHSDAIPHADRPRGLEVSDSDSAVEAWYRLDSDDLDVLADLESPEQPTWYYRIKRYDGTTQHGIRPWMTRDLSKRRKAEQALNRFALTQAGRDLERRESPDDPELLGDLVERVLSLLSGDAELEDADVEVIRALIEGFGAGEPAGLRARALTALGEWLESDSATNPSTVALRRLSSRWPKFSAFTDAARSLASDYDIADVAEEPPTALANLALVAGLDLRGLAAAVEIQDVAEYVSATEAANDRLAEIFAEAWKQSVVTVRLHLDATTLRIMVSNEGGGYSSIAERSDGLKAFVALTAFAAQEREGERPIILLIDEAERHLHYDAQADLVRMLERQGLAQQVIYTTHSSGCLPLDLGTGIRPVVPEAGGGRSVLSNSFWTTGRGFQPLLMALGAGAAAFTPSRYAVLAEGASDMLLLPSLIREATGKPRLDYQIAPGVAEASWEQLAELDLEAPRVAYVLDGDAGGGRHAQRLEARGVPQARIVQLGGSGSGVTTEDLLREDTYLRAANEILKRVHGEVVGPLKGHDLPKMGRSAAVDQWCDVQGIKRLSKTALAATVLEYADSALLTQHSRQLLRQAHSRLSAALGLPA